MSERYDTSGEYGDKWPGMDEMLCEYVDGTMDPTVQKVFEECLRTDDALAERAQALRCTRSLLCRYGCQQARSERASSSSQSTCPSSTAYSSFRLKTIGGLSAAVTVALMVGLFVGAGGFDNPLFLLQSSTVPAVQEASSPPRPAASHQNAWMLLNHSRPFDFSVQTGGFQPASAPAADTMEEAVLLRSVSGTP